MKLKIPGTNIDFVVTPQYFVSVFDVYDREESLGEYLNSFDPNIPTDLQRLFHEFMFSGIMVDKYKLEHKAEIARVLAKIVSDDQFDYSKVFEDDSDCENPISLPSKWKINNPRQFFLEAYKSLCDHWGRELGLDGQI